MNPWKIIGGMAALVVILGTLLTGLFWVFEVQATAAEGLRVANEAKQAATAKADADDIQRLEQEVRDLRHDLEERDLIDRKR